MVLMCLGISSQAQMIVVPREKLDAVNNPRLSDMSSAFKFEAVSITAETINEDGGMHVFTYPFENVSQDTLHISRLVTTCSCAAASCDKMMIAPGETSEIVVSYNPKGHPGRFERKVFVYVGKDESPAAVLRLFVTVERGADITGLYPVSMGNIRVRRQDVYFIKGRKAVEVCAFMNVSDKPLKLQSESAMMPMCLNFKAEPEIVAPGEEGRIIIEYDPAKGGERPSMPVMIKGLGVPPTQSAVTVYIKEK